MINFLSNCLYYIQYLQTTLAESISLELLPDCSERVETLAEETQRTPLYFYFNM